MFKSIVVPLDGSAHARKALPYAEYLARAARGRVLLVRAADTWGLTPKQRAEKDLAIRRRARAELSGLALSLTAGGVPTEWQVDSGEAATVVTAAAAAHQADLIVMSTHGRSGLGRWAYGSVAERILRAGLWPSLLVPPRCADCWSSTEANNVLVPLDGSTLAEDALGPARALAQVLGRRLTLAQVIEPPSVTMPSARAYSPAPNYEERLVEARLYLDAVAHRLQDDGFVVETAAEVGYAAATLSRMANAHSATIVMATHGWSGITRVVMGSVASGVIQRAGVPVLIKRPGQVAGQP